MTKPPSSSFPHYITIHSFFSRLVVSRGHFFSLARRLGRVFAHAYFRHLEAFEQAGAEALFMPLTPIRTSLS